jgi:putative N-acetylmannosamine-6-phosphate epimerase
MGAGIPARGVQNIASAASVVAVLVVGVVIEDMDPG